MILTWREFLESVGTISISDQEEYTNAMILSSSDKTFFLNKIKTDVIVDFGCADGRILHEIEQLRPNKKLIGYDLSQEMLDKAKHMVSKDVLLTTEWNKAISEISNCKNPTLLLSSVIHEVYSYSNGKLVQDFWNNKVFGGDFKYIVIRDMISPLTLEKKYKKLFEEDVRKVKSKFNKEYTDSFENRWGRMEDSYRTFIHFLLKYKYLNNWSRENSENYVPISTETLLKKIPSGYSVVYKRNYIFNILQREIRKDFGIKIDFPTHLQLIIKNNNFYK